MAASIELPFFSKNFTNWRILRFEFLTRITNLVQNCMKKKRIFVN